MLHNLFLLIIFLTTNISPNNSNEIQSEVHLYEDNLDEFCFEEGNLVECAYCERLAINIVAIDNEIVGLCEDCFFGEDTYESN
jgi:hypothetical protein